MTPKAGSYMTPNPEAGAEPGLDADAPLTDTQAIALKDLCHRTGEPYDGNLTQVEAARRIARLHEIHELQRG